MAKSLKTSLQLFFEKVNASGECWEWNAAIFPSGYGCFQAGGRSHRAHRWLYEVLFGKLADSVVVRHDCDNRRCVRPDHLRTGSHRDNQRDKAERNRSLYGERNPKAKLCADQVHEIRRRYDHGENRMGLAREFGVSAGAVYFIGERRNWRRLPEAAPV